MNTDNIIKRIFESGFRQGYKEHKQEAPFFGTGFNSPDAVNIDNSLTEGDIEEWEEKLTDDIDLSNIVYGEVKTDGWNDSSRSYLYHVPREDDDSDGQIRHRLSQQLDLGMGGRRVEHMETDPAEYIDKLKAEVNQLKEENDALRATHPDGDIMNIDDEWELEADSRSEVTVPLNGDHVFDHAVIEYDIELMANRGDAGTVNAYIDIGDVKLVSKN